jgi:hypothetical protein
MVDLSRRGPRGRRATTCAGSVAPGAAGRYARGVSTPRERGSIDPHAATAVSDGDGAAVTLAAQRRAAGDTIGRYRIDGVLGEGGMGVVYRAHDLDLDRPVAIKRLRPELRGAQERLLREGQAVARLRHPHVITIFDVGVDGDDLFIAMELVDGRTLRGWLREAARPWREVLGVAVAAGRGLAAAHRAGLVHRDFKPDNVLVGHDGRVVVGDFGLARLDPAGAAAPGDPALELTRTGAVAGTPAYMSPEQFAGQPVDARSDQFSFCVTLWEALYGARPFADAAEPATFAGLAAAVAAGRLREPADRRGVPRRIHAALRRGLAVSPDARFASIDALVGALTARRRGAWLAGGAAAVAACAAIAYVAWPRGGPATAATAATAPDVCEDRSDAIAAVWSPAIRAAHLERFGGEPHLDDDVAGYDAYAAQLGAAFPDACGDDARRACLDGALDDLRTAVARADRRYWPRLRAIDRCGAPEPVLREVTDAANAVKFLLAPDGVRIAVQRPGGTPILIRDAAGGVRTLGPERAIRWLPDGRIAAVDAGGRLALIEADTGRVAEAHELGDGLVLDVSPGLTHVAIRVGEELRIATLGGAEVARLPVPPHRMRASFSPDDARLAVVDFNELRVVDLRTGATARADVRVHVHNTGTLSVQWLDASHLLLGGSAVAGVEGDLWRWRVGDDGALSGSPAVLVRGRPDRALLPAATAGGVALVLAIDLRHTLRFAGVFGSVLSGANARRTALAFDRTRARLLIGDPAHDRWTWIDLDGGAVTTASVALPAVEGMQLDVRDGEVRALVPGGASGSVFVELGADGQERGRVALEPGMVFLDCDARCDLLRSGAPWQITPVSATGLGEPRPVEIDVETWYAPDLSADRQRLAYGDGGDLVIRDLRSGIGERLRSSTCAQLQHVWFEPDDRALVYSCISVQSEYAIVRRALSPGAPEEVLGSGPDWVRALIPVESGLAVAALVSYHQTLHLVDLAAP